MKKGESNAIYWGIGILLLGLWGASWVGLLYFMPAPLLDDKQSMLWSQRGQFGDMFGAVNSLFSGMAFFGVVVAIFLQRRDLKVQQDMLNATVNEQKAASEALTKQVNLMRDTALINALLARISDAEKFILESAVDSIKIDKIRIKNECQKHLDDILAPMFEDYKKNK